MQKDGCGRQENSVCTHARLTFSALDLAMLADMKKMCPLLILACLATGCTTASMKLERSIPPDSKPRGDAPQFIYFGGEFRQPGNYPWASGMTLKAGIRAAGGFDYDASRELWVHHWDGSEERYKLGPRMMITINPELKPGDRILCPRRL